MLRRPPRSTLFPYTTLFRSIRLLELVALGAAHGLARNPRFAFGDEGGLAPVRVARSEEHTSELQSLTNLVCRLLLEKKKKKNKAKYLMHVTYRNTLNK